MMLSIERDVIPRIPEHLRTEILTKIETQYGSRHHLNAVVLLDLINFELNLISLQSPIVLSGGDTLPTPKAISEALRGPSTDAQVIAEVDQILCENIIDPCGYVPENETKQDLIRSVKATSEALERALKLLRGEG